MLGWRPVRFIWLFIVMLVWPVLLHAQSPTTVQVVALDSDDASEDQADALTAALRQRVRSSPPFQLVDSNQPLATLLPALNCPSRPDGPCLNRIGDQLKTDRFFWGTVKTAGSHQVAAEVHLWTRNRPEQVASETFSDNLKDQNDDALRRIAAKLYDQLTGQSTHGSVVVHANAQVGTVIVDGKPTAQLDHGHATLVLGSGTHTVDVKVDNMTSSAQDISVVVNTQNDITFDLTPIPVAPPAPPSTPHPRRIVGFVLIGVAAAAAITSAVLGGVYAGDANTWHTFATGVTTADQHICTDSAEKASLANSTISGISVDGACNARSHAYTESVVAWSLAGAALGLAVIGVILVATDGGKERSVASRLRVLPTLGPNGGGLSALVTF
jgi:hypothetical protein